MKKTSVMNRILSLVLAVMCSFQLLLPAMAVDIGRTTGAAALGESTLGESAVLGGSTLGSSSMLISLRASDGNEQLSSKWSNGASTLSPMNIYDTQTITFTANFSVPANDYRVIVTVPEAFAIKNYYQADTAGTDSTNPFSAVSSATSGTNTVLTFTVKSSFSGMASFNVDVAANKKKVHNNMSATVTSQLWGLDASGTDAVLKSDPGVTATIRVYASNGWHVRVNYTGTYLYTGIEHELGLYHILEPYASGQSDYFGDNGDGVRPYTASNQIHLDKIQIKTPSDGAARAITAAELAAIDAVTYVGCGYTYSAATKTITFDNAEISWGKRQIFRIKVANSAAIPNNTILYFNNINALDIVAYENNFTGVADAMVTATTSPNNYYAAAATTGFTVKSTTVPETNIFLRKTGADTTSVYLNQSNQQLFTVYAKNDMYELNNLSFEVNIPAGMTVTHIGLPAANPGYLSGQTDYSGPAAATVGGTTTALTLNGYTALPSPVSGGTITITLGQLGQGKNIFYPPTRADHYIDQGIRFVGSQSASSATVTLGAVKADIASLGTGVTVNNLYTGSQTINAAATVAQDVFFSTVQFYKEDKSATVSSVNISDELWLVSNISTDNYGHRALTPYVDEPVFYMVIPKEFCSPDDDLDWTAADAAIFSYSGSKNANISVAGVRTVKSGATYLPGPNHPGSVVVEIRLNKLEMQDYWPNIYAPAMGSARIGLKLKANPATVAGETQVTLGKRDVLIGVNGSTAAEYGAGHSIARDLAANLLPGSGSYVMNMKGSHLGYYNIESYPSVTIKEQVFNQMQVEMDPGTGTYVSYVPNSGDPIPAMHSDETGTLRVSIVNKTVQDSSLVTGYFILPRYVDSGTVQWKTLADGQFIENGSNYNGLPAPTVTVGYTTTEFSSDQTLASMNALPASAWGPYSTGMQITAIKFTLANLPRGGTYVAELPFRVPGTGGGVNYGQSAIGQTLYDMGLVINGVASRSDTGATAALTLTKSGAPTATPALTASDTQVEYKLGSLPSNWSMAAYADDVSSVTSAPGYPVTTFQPEGGGAVISNMTVAAVNAQGTSQKGVYTVQFQSTADADGQTGTATRTITVKDTTPAILSVPSTYAIGIGTNTLAHWTNYFKSNVFLSITDSQDAEDRSKVTVNMGSFDPDVWGSYTIQLGYTDPAGNASAPVTSIIHVGTLGSNGTVPAITAPDKRLVLGSAAAGSYTWMSEITANDLEDGNLTSSVLLTQVTDIYGNTSSPIQTALAAAAGMPNRYTASYSVTDSDGNTVTKSRTIMVGTAGTTGLNPWIVAQDKDLSLNESYTWLTDVKAYDLDDVPHDITGKVVVTSVTDIYGTTTASPSPLDTSVPNKYVVDYQVTDSDGNTATASRVIKVGDKDASGRYKPWIKAENVNVSLNSSYGLYDDVTAWDIEDGEITSALTITQVRNFRGQVVAQSAYTTSEYGKWYVDYSVLDSDGNSAADSRHIGVSDIGKGGDMIPWIIAPDHIMELGDSYGLLDDVEAWDVEDGDITGKLKVIKLQGANGREVDISSYDVWTPNIWTVTYEVTDSAGNTRQQSRVISSVASDGKGGRIPWIVAPDKVREMRESYGIMQEIEAWDLEDGNITDSVKVVKVLSFGREIPTGKYRSTGAGFWAVTYEVTDSDGNTVQATRSISQNSSDSGSTAENKVQTEPTTYKPKPVDKDVPEVDDGTTGGESDDLDLVPEFDEEDEEDDVAADELNPPTGDDAPIDILVSVAVFSLAILIIMAVSKHREKKARVRDRTNRQV